MMTNTPSPIAARLGIVARIKRDVKARVLKRWGSVAVKGVVERHFRIWFRFCRPTGDSILVFR